MLFLSEQPNKKEGFFHNYNHEDQWTITALNI